jgi:histidyl-tRNA synthetase
MAERLGVRFALIFGQKEALEGTVMVRELETGIQETIPLEKIIDELKKRLKSK